MPVRGPASAGAGGVEAYPSGPVSAGATRVKTHLSGPAAAECSQARGRLSAPAGVRARNEAGSVLALVPAAFLVLIFLAALAVDSAVAFQAHEQLHDMLAGAANDAVTGGLDQRAFYSKGQIALDSSAVDGIVCEALGAENLSSFHDLSVGVSVSGDYVRVSARGSVDAVFGRAIPGYGTRWISATADADVQNGPQSGPVPVFPPATILSC